MKSNTQFSWAGNSFNWKQQTKTRLCPHGACFFMEKSDDLKSIQKDP
jgi:hypothetical protein